MAAWNFTQIPPHIRTSSSTRSEPKGHGGHPHAPDTSASLLAILIHRRDLNQIRCDPNSLETDGELNRESEAN